MSRAPFSDDQVESLVRAYLAGEALRVDVAGNMAAIARRQRASAQQGGEDASFGGLPVAAPRVWPWKLAAAACLVAAGLVCWQLVLTPETASAYSLVREAHGALAKRVDRCYQVECSVPRGWLRDNPLLPAGGSALVWTRGDRFRVTTPDDDKPLVWGQDAAGRLWVALAGGRAGLQFEKRETPAALARTRAYLCLDVKRLAKRFLDDFDLTIEKVPRARRSGVVVINATARPDVNTLFNLARIELDSQTRAIRRLELTRVRGGEPRAVFSFTLVGESTQADAQYELTGNLAQGAAIWDRDHAAERQQQLRALGQQRR